MRFLDLLWLVPILPFAGAVANAALGRRPPKPVVTAIGVGAPLASLLLALGIFWEYAGHHPARVVQTLYAWTAGPLDIPVAFQMDPLAAVMTFVVTFVGFLIHVYSVGYMGHEEGYRRYFCYLNLFMSAMLLLVLGNNYLVMFVGWEGVGLCSYLLIGFYYTEPFPPYAGKKAFIVNRVGDFAFLVGMFALVAHFGTLTYSELFPRIAAEGAALAAADYAFGLSLPAFVALCFFVGAMGKSAQIPLYVWLPDAMAGPTPVSALIHAATMVTAGVYMIVRSNVIYLLAPDVSTFVAVIGAATALFAATIGIAQTDIKKVLAYSTVSQLGYMFLAAGLGAYSAAIFHLGTHAFFKALLFLGSGSVIHAMGGEQDMRKMGGLRKQLPATFRTFVIGAAALAGLPPLAGFFSKDEILHAAAADGHWVLWAVGLTTAGLTAFYMFRAVFLTFWGEFRGSEEQRHHLHESPAVMTVPLWILAAGAVIAGFFGVPRLLTLGALPENWLGRFLAPVVEAGGHGGAEHAVSHALEWGLIALAVAVAAGGIALAWAFYGGAQGLTRGREWAGRLPRVHEVLVNKYYVDELYDRAIVKPLAALSRFFWKAVDTFVIDGAINAGAFVTELVGDVGRFSTTGNVRNYALYFFLGVIALFAWLVLV
jgi:NADH-quinone oxidoreductase subunit L